MPLADELAFLDGTAQADLVRRGEVSALELVDAAIARAERLNPGLNAIVTPLYERARTAAAQPRLAGRFVGVPFLLKDFVAEARGTPLTEGSAYLRAYISNDDSELVRRFEQAGLIVLGKSNTPEFAIGVSTEPRLYGPTRNPWNVTRIAGGSSGGSAAAVAAGIVPIAHGSDAGGSIRIPASCCGLFGLKPTRGRSPYGPRLGELFAGFQVDHVLTRSVRDSAAVLDVIAAPDPGWLCPAPRPERAFADEVGVDPGRLRIAFTARTPLGTELHPDCAAAMQHAAALCAALGHEVNEAAPTFDAESLWTAFTTILAVGVAARAADWQARTGRAAQAEEFEPFMRAFIEHGQQRRGTDYVLALQRIQQNARCFSDFFAAFDIWLTPTLGAPPVPLGTFAYDQGDPFLARRRAAVFSPFAYLSNATGQPAMSLPLFWNGDNLPIGTQFVGRFGAEATLIRLASQLEQAHPWTQHRPPLAL